MDEMNYDVSNTEQNDENYVSSCDLRRELEKAANEGDIRAMVELGDLYIDDFEVATENQQELLDKAQEWYLLAANQGSEDAAYRMSLFLNAQYVHWPNDERNMYAVPNMEERIPWLLKATECEYPVPRALYNLAECYYKGDGVPKDMQKAVKYYIEAANLGITEAMVRLGYINYEESNYDNAVYYLSQAYNNPDKIPEKWLASVHYILVECYFQDRVQIDKKAALPLLEYSIEKKYYEAGKDPEMSRRRFVYWAVKAGTMNKLVLLMSYGSECVLEHNDEQMAIIENEARNGNIFAKKIIYIRERDLYIEARNTGSLDGKGCRYYCGMDYALDLIRVGDLQVLYDEGERLAVFMNDPRGEQLKSEAVRLGYNPPTPPVNQNNTTNSGYSNNTGYTNNYAYANNGGNYNDYDYRSDPNYGNNFGYSYNNDSYSSGNNYHVDTDADYAARSYGYQDAQDFENQNGVYGTEDNIYAYGDSDY